MAPRAPLRARHREALRISARVLLLAGTLGGLFACGGDGSPPSPTHRAPPAPADFPRPDLSAFEPNIRQQVTALQRRVVELRELAKEDSARLPELAEALGDLGNQYHAFLFLEAAETCYAQAAEIDPGDFRWPYYRGVTLGHQGRDAKAVRAFEKVRELTSGTRTPEATTSETKTSTKLATQIRLGDLHLKLGQAEEAHKSFQHAIEIDSHSPAAWFGLGRAAVLAGEDAEAVRHFEKTLELAPEAAAVHYPLAQAYRRLGDLASARRHLELHGPGGLSFADPLMQRVLLREVDTAIDTLRSLAAQPERMSAEELVQTALGQLGDKGGAVERFRYRVETEGSGVDPPYQARVHYMLGRLLQKSGKPEAAARHLEEALRLDPALDTAAARLRRAQESLRRNDPTAAERELRRALELDLSAADRALVWHRLGELARRGGSAEEAVTRYRRALEIDPELLDARLGLATALGRLGRYSEAVREFRQVSEGAPERIDAWLGEATALVLAGRFREARQRLEKGLETTPDSVPLARTLARILASAPDPSVRDGRRALELAHRVMEAEPTSASAETLAMALARNGRFDEAASLQEQLVHRAEQSGDPAAATRLHANLERYRAGRPCCEG
jgi:tetratricopeptide (TPR) repeat protein